MLSYDQVAKELGVSVVTVKRWAARSWNPLPIVHLSKRCVRIRPAELDKWLERAGRIQPNRRLKLKAA